MPEQWRAFLCGRSRRKSRKGNATGQKEKTFATRQHLETSAYFVLDKLGIWP
jgi:hypothetical protein